MGVGHIPRAGKVHHSFFVPERGDDGTCRDGGARIGKLVQMESNDRVGLFVVSGGVVADGNEIDLASAAEVPAVVSS